MYTPKVISKDTEISYHLLPSHISSLWAHNKCKSVTNINLMDFLANFLGTNAGTNVTYIAPD